MKDLLSAVAKDLSVDEKLLRRILQLEQELLDLDSRSDEGTERIRSVLEGEIK